MSKKILAERIKAALLHHTPGLVATEIPTYGIGDVVGIKLAEEFVIKEIVEYEVKVSKSNLWADLKKGKYQKTNKGYRLKLGYPVDKFYYCVPLNLVAEALKFLEWVNPEIGLKQYVEGDIRIYKNKPSCRQIEIKSVKRCRKLKHIETDKWRRARQYVLRSMVQRCSNFFLKSALDKAFKKENPKEIYW